MWDEISLLSLGRLVTVTQMEVLEGTSLAGQFNCVNMLISTIVSCTWVALGVFVGHGRTQCIEDGAGGNILGSDEDD